jgi:hypothetical protein
MAAIAEAEMTAAPQSPLVEKVAESVASIIDDAISNGAIRFMGRERTPYLPTDTAYELAGQIIAACHGDEMLEVIRSFQAKYDFGDCLPADHPVSAARALLAKLDGPSSPPHSLGYCPICGSPGRSREKRPNGDDLCEAGHKYPSSSALLAKQDGQS